MKKAFLRTDSVLVKFRSGVAVYVLLMQEDGSTFELRGAVMWRWLSELGQHLKIYPKPSASSPQTSLAFTRPKGSSNGQ